MSNSLNRVGVYSGGQFSPLNPIKEDVNIIDIAHSLSNICRFNGHSRFFYSIAQHSIAVRNLIKNDNLGIKMELYGILHDASESLISDILSPVKSCINGYKDIERNIEDVIYDAFNIPRPTPEEHKIIKKYDIMALYVEAKHLMLGYEKWDNIIIFDNLDYPIDKRDPEEVERMFLWRFYDLMANMKNNF